MSVVKGVGIDICGYCIDEILLQKRMCISNVKSTSNKNVLKWHKKILKPVVELFIDSQTTLPNLMSSLIHQKQYYNSETF